MRRLTVLAACLLLVAAGCGKSTNKAKNAVKNAKNKVSETVTGSGPQTRTVKVDGKTDKFNAGFLAYFPNEVTVRPGDTIDFQEVWTGEPHTVTMGTLAEKGLAAAKSAPENGPPPPDFASLPTLLPEGPGDAHQNAAQPCYLETGSPPTDQENKPCPKVAQPAFNGRQTYYNSGFLPEGASFKVKLADDIAPATYHYYCNLHGPEMSGSIVVKPSGADIPSADDVTKAATSQLDDIVNRLAGPYQSAKGGKAPFPGNLAGFGAQDVMNAGIEEFIPATINAKVGEKVVWTVVGAHTITFGAPPELKQSALEVAPDGSVHAVRQALAPAGGPGQPPQPQTSGPPPSGPPPPPKVVDGGKYDGTGFHSSGLFLSFPPMLSGYSLTFTKAGTYNYICAIHPGMSGVVNVT